MEFIFTLKYRLPVGTETLPAIEEALVNNHCDDALAGVGQPGRLALEFSRKAESARHAIHSALADVKRALPASVLIEATPDLVGLSDVADIARVSRQYMRKLMLANPDSFPSPVHEGSTSVWHLADLLNWLAIRGVYAAPPELRETARATQEVNQAKAAYRLPTSLVRNLEPLIA